MSEEAPGGVHYDFKLSDERKDSFFLQKEMKDSLRQWGMEDTLSLTQAMFCPAFMPHEETAFVHQLLSFAAEQASKPMTSFPTAQNVRWEALKCTAMSMDFFDCLIEKGIVNKSRNIRGCFPDVFGGVSVSDKLRELLVNPDSENADVFSADQQEELLFHLFRALSVGGGVCQPDERLEPYLVATKALYKDLVSVQKNTATGELEIAACKVYRIIETSNGLHINDRHSSSSGNATGEVTDGVGSSSWNTVSTSSEPSPHNVCLVVVDLTKKRASVLRKEFVPFW